jgi:hypothetical protein
MPKIRRRCSRCSNSTPTSSAVGTRLATTLVPSCPITCAPRARARARVGLRASRLQCLPLPLQAGTLPTRREPHCRAGLPDSRARGSAARDLRPPSPIPRSMLRHASHPSGKTPTKGARTGELGRPSQHPRRSLHLLPRHPSKLAALRLRARCSPPIGLRLPRRTLRPRLPTSDRVPRHRVRVLRRSSVRAPLMGGRPLRAWTVYLFRRPQSRLASRRPEKPRVRTCRSPPPGRHLP